MKDPALAAEIVSAVVRAVRLPVTVKIRAGWDRDSVNASEFAKALEQAGASLVCVHARTREQLYAPGIDLSVIEAVKNSVKIPVIGNGDIASAEDALFMMDRTGCDGVMIGRGAMGNPWIFAELSAALEHRDFIAPTFSERMAIALEHLDGMLSHKGERVGLAEAKKHMAWYLTGVHGAAATRAAIMTAQSSEDLRALLMKMQSEGADI
jgi:nifR3 family TIM-barrel protein